MTDVRPPKAFCILLRSSGGVMFLRFCDVRVCFAAVSFETRVCGVLRNDRVENLPSLLPLPLLH